MDAVLLALINKLKSNVNSQINSALSGVDTYEVDGLNLVVKLNDGTERTIAFDQPAIDDVSLQPDADDNVHLTITMNDGSIFDAGVIPAGASAFQIAQANGFTGTEQEWLDSLPGRHSPLTFIFDTPSTDWEIQFNLNDKYVRVVCEDEEGDEIIGAEVERVNENFLIVHFEIPVAGKAIIC